MKRIAFLAAALSCLAAVFCLFGPSPALSGPAAPGAASEIAPPYPAKSGTLQRFAIVSDSHVGGPARSVYGDIVRILEKEGINVIFHAGDAINRPGSRAQWARFMELTGQGMTLHIAAGNHDVEGARSLSTFVGLFGAPYSSFSAGDTLFLLLNTELPGEESRIAGRQLDWLEAELARPFACKIVFLHEPLFPVFARHGLDRHEAERDGLHRLFVRSGVSLVVAGHDHVYRRTGKDGVTYVICGKSGGIAWPGIGGRSYRYIIAERSKGAYRFTVKDIEGDLKDSFTVAVRPAEANARIGGAASGQIRP